ncbi:MAG: DNA methyltransferase [Pseudomonadota bacterium]
MNVPIGVERLAISSLKPSKRNARTHSKKQIKQIATSIREFGFINPVLIDESGTILAGHGRVDAAKELGMTEVPVVRIEHMTEAQKRAYVIADNQLALHAGWDEAILAIEFEELGDLGFDLSLTGFEMGDIDQIIANIGFDGDEVEEPSVPEPSSGPAITQPGDIWQIGTHRLICGDATKPDTYDRLLDGAKADLVFTDPPYNVPIDGHVSGLGKQTHREFTMASGEMTEKEFEAFLRTVFGQLARFSKDGAIHYICMDWRHMGEVLAAAEDTYSELKNLCVWAKSNGGMGSLYRSQHELVFVFKSGTARHINNVKLGKHGRNRTNLWSYAGANAFSETRDDDLAMHPTVKPLALVKDAILDCSNRNSIVLDGFAGSGTTLLAAHETGRKGYGVEIDPAYCDVILTRLKAAGLILTHAETGQVFNTRAMEAAHVG